MDGLAASRRRASRSGNVLQRRYRRRRRRATQRRESLGTSRHAPLMEHITLIVFLHSTATYESGPASLECSVKIACEVTLARHERLTSVSIDDERYTVQVVSD